MTINLLFFWSVHEAEKLRNWRLNINKSAQTISVQVVGFTQELCKSGNLSTGCFYLSLNESVLKNTHPTNRFAYLGINFSFRLAISPFPF